MGEEKVSNKYLLLWVLLLEVVWVSELTENERGGYGERRLDVASFLLFW